VLTGALEVVQEWVDAEEANYAKISSRDRVYTMGRRTRLAMHELTTVR